VTTDVPLVLPSLLQRIQDPENLGWRPFRKGVEIYPIYGDPRQGPSAALLRYEPGSGVPAHTHTGHEHILVLSGSQSDRNGTYGEGTLVVNPPGSVHEVHSASGCVVLVIWEKPVCFE
jgi:anti-sigma factor ChrR (cupin superfamily)